jgi:hypothetical protein
VNRHVRIIVLSLVAMVPAACGSKGPPLAPLRPVPAVPTEFAARRAGDRVTLRFVVPSANQDPAVPLSIARVEIYAQTFPMGAAPPTPDQLVRREARVASLEIRPPAPPPPAGEPPAAVPAPAAPPDSRPGPGEIAVWSETVTAAIDKSLPATRSQDARFAERGPVWMPLAPSGLVVPFVPVTLPTRYYVVVGVSARGRAGRPSAMIAVPFGPPPEAPAKPVLSHTETTLTLTWTTRDAGAPVTVVETTKAGEERPAPVTVEPITTGTWSTPVEFGVERCFVVRRVIRYGALSTESATPEPACSTPKDTFPPPAPTGLVPATAGGADVTLLWDPVTSADLAGYHVLRGEGTGEVMQPITKELVTGRQWADTTTRSGVRYFYTVIAVDTAGNPSAQSNRIRVDR